MMRADALNSENHPVITEMTGVSHIPILHVRSMGDSKSKGFLVDEKLLQVCSTDKDKSKRIIFDVSST